MAFKLSSKELRLQILKEAIEMADHNLLCYSNNYMMSIPKAGYEKEWEKEQTIGKELRKWYLELSEQLYKEGYINYK